MGFKKMKKTFISEKNASIFFNSIYANNFEKASKIIDKYPDVVNYNVQFTNMTPLFLAIHKSNEELVELLLQNNINLKHRDWYGRDALMIACKLGKSSRIVELLLKSGSKPTRLDKKGKTCLHHLVSCSDNRTERNKIIDLILSPVNPYYKRLTKGRINSQDNRKQTAIMISVMKGNTNLSKKLIAEGADLTLANYYHQTPQEIGLELGTVTYGLFLQFQKNNSPNHSIKTCNLSGLKNLRNLDDSIFVDFHSLETLNLSNTKIRTLPSSLLNCSHLKKVNIKGTPLYNSLPSSKRDSWKKIKNHCF
eukprot:TRINITY_DN1737_c0_g1_i1.p1 TRINITY_DN1737_c0_g1~~TRINITY_DN1737_c0_g1_i1.p1  ORF type:complete len:307 (+),score=63.11 TRINITY_DN1737_c0_g1_i1:95-1015(+)